jgi:hypothetical protein
MNRINAEAACLALQGGRRLGNRQWPGHRTVGAQDMHEVTPEVLRSLVDEAAADDWYIIPAPVIVSGDGSADNPFMLDPSALNHAPGEAHWPQ